MLENIPGPTHRFPQASRAKRLGLLWGGFTLASAIGGSAGALAGCGDRGTTELSRPNVARETQRATWDDDPMRIESAGHGRVFDAKGNAIEIDLKLIGRMQATMKSEVLKAVAPTISDEAAAMSKDADVLLADPTISFTDKLMLDGSIIWRLLQEGSDVMIGSLEWRLEVLMSRISFKPGYSAVVLSPAVATLIDRTGYRDWLVRFPLDKTYSDRCRDAGVPVPPDWAETGTAWQRQGTLRHNILSPGGYAEVWTYQDPANRGACVILPRGSGDPGSLAGIICQSATTGAACFWDNKLRNQIPEQALGWRGITLRISTLKDGSNLTENCTSCHRGNNVFLISPDDETWANVLRGTYVTAPGATFTTRVEASADMLGDRPRYYPITTLDGRPGWENTYNPTGGYCAGCHEHPPQSVMGLNRPPMPPACAIAAGGCYAP